MGAITLSGKGSRSRVRDRSKYRANFDEIVWPSRNKAGSKVADRDLQVDTAENQNSAFQQWSADEDRRLIENSTPSTPDEIETAVRVVRRINFGAAYGRDPKLCAASNEVLRALGYPKPCDEVMLDEAVNGGDVPLSITP